MNIPPETKKVSLQLTAYQAWARPGKSGKDSKGDCVSGGSLAYGPLDGNHILWIRDGARAMFEISDAICRATRFVWIIDCYLSPGINLARNCGEANYYDQLKQNASNYPDPQILDKVKQLNSTHNVDSDSVPLVSLLFTKAQESYNGNQVKVRIILFKPDLLQEKAAGKTGWDGARDIIKTWNQDKKYANKINLQLAEWGGAFTSGHEVGAHHQKSTIVAINDKLVGFCGGVDLAYSRWNPSSHSIADPIDSPSSVPAPFKINSEMDWIQSFDPPGILGEWNGRKNEYRGEGGYVFWHDVHVKVVGSAAAQLASNFQERYEQTNSTPSGWKNDTDFSWFNTNVSHLWYDEGPQDLLNSSESYSGAKIYAQIIRSWFERKWGGGNDWGIWDAYRNLFSHAERNIYIESQYAFEDSDLADILIKRIKQNQNLKVIIVAPVMPDSYDGDIMKTLKKIIVAGSKPGDDLSKSRVKAYSLATLISRSGNNIRVPIYVHAKIAVVDDEWAVVGSANLDRMGMGGGSSSYRGSSELAILINGPSQSVALRSLLAAEHLGTTSPPDDFDQLFDSFYNTASANGDPRGGGALNGQLVIHRTYSGK